VTRGKKGKSGGQYVCTDDSMIYAIHDRVNYVCRCDESIDARHANPRSRELSADIARKRARREQRGGMKLCNDFYQRQRSLPLSEERIGRFTLGISYLRVKSMKITARVPKTRASVCPSVRSSALAHARVRARYRARYLFKIIDLERRDRTRRYLSHDRFNERSSDFRLQNGTGCV